jgi:hypothetical protein
LKESWPELKLDRDSNRRTAYSLRHHTLAYSMIGSPEKSGFLEFGNGTLLARKAASAWA